VNSPLEPLAGEANEANEANQGQFHAWLRKALRGEPSEYRQKQDRLIRQEELALT